MFFLAFAPPLIHSRRSERRHDLSFHYREEGGFLKSNIPFDFIQMGGAIGTSAEQSTGELWSLSQDPLPANHMLK